MPFTKKSATCAALPTGALNIENIEPLAVKNLILLQCKIVLVELFSSFQLIIIEQ
jgi:hypothetical protein